MATLLLAPPTTAAPPPLGTAELVVLLSPIRGADGQLRVTRTPVDAGQPLGAVLPVRHTWGKVIVNGRVLTTPEHATWQLQPGDEVLAIPEWGLLEGALGVLLVQAAIGIAVSVALTGLTYLLFPPAKPHIQGPAEDPSFSFDGIRTTVGPGGVVPVVYGRQRIGGQLLSWAVDEVLTVLDDGASERRVTAIAGSSTMSLLLALCEGPIDAVLTDTIEINGQPIQNFPTAQAFWRGGQGDQPPIAEFLETRNTFAVGVELSNSSVIYTTTAAVNAFTLNLAFLEGLFFMSRHGEKETNSSFLQYRFRPAGGSYTDYVAYRIDANRTAPVRFGIRREGLPLAIYDIEVFWASAWNTDETRSKWLPTLVGVTEIQSNTNAFPYTALLGLRAIATDQLQGGLPNVTVEVNGRLVRVNTFSPNETWSDNPAWCLMDAMTNARYGLGASGATAGRRGIADADIDLGAFATWAAYNEEDLAGERRHTCNYVLDREIRAQPFLLETMGGSRTLLVKTGGLWQPRPTRDQAPSQLLTWANVTNLTVTYTRDPDRINVMEAKFDNEENGYQTDVVTWPPVAQWPADVRKMSLEMRGVTKPSRIMRALQFERNRRRYENVTLSLDASLEAITFSVHDLFRFVHPMPGWSVSGRLQEGSTQEHLILDEEVTLETGLLYHVYVRNADDTTQIVPVVNTGGTRQTLDLAGALGQTPVPRLSVWALGTYTAEGVDLTGRVFRATKVQRRSDTTVHIEAVIHNPSIFDQADGTPLPVLPTLPNPLGPSPPLTHLIATEVTRVQPSGTSLRVVNLSWDVAGLASGYGPYGGAEILRRTVLESGLAGQATLGLTAMGAVQDTADSTDGYVPLARVTGHALDFDDYTVITGGTYSYRVIPVSQRGIPNNLGSLDVLIHVAGPTTPDYFPGTVRNLRLKGQAVGVTTYEGRDIHFEWDPVADSPLFNDTFFVQDYRVQVWAPGQTYLMRATTVPGRPHGERLDWAYTYAMNEEDNIRAGEAGARRDIWLFVWARTNTNRQSLDAAVLGVTNGPPDMSEIVPECTPLTAAAIISWTQWVEPRDFARYVVRLDTVNPPLAISQDLGIAFRKLLLSDLIPLQPYWVQIEPWDTFGVGVASQIATFIPSTDGIDRDPPAVPSGLTLTTGTTVSPDGTVLAWIQASWTPSPEPDIAGYELHFRIAPNPSPTVFTVGATEHTARLESAPGGVTVFVRILTFDRFHNTSPFTSEVSILTARDGVPPAAPTNLTAIGSIRSIALLWTPPPDADYAGSQVWASTVNNRANASLIGSGQYSFVHEGLGPTQTVWYWVRAVDTSGNPSTNFYPLSATGGIAGQAGQLDTTFISSLAANKIIAGVITALVSIGAANLTLDGVNSQLWIVDQDNHVRIQLGKLGPLSSDWGLRIFNAAGVMMWNLTDGTQTAGIADTAITAQKIAVGVIEATHLRTDVAVITVAAQIANALIGDAHISHLAADKIAAGTISSTVYMGAGQRILLDGVNDLLAVRDGNGNVRIWLGKLGPLTTDYGLSIFGPSGDIMWNFSGGVTTQGITPAAVVTTSIGTNAVNETIGYSNPSGGLTTTNIETVIGSITLPTVLPGDQVWITVSANAFVNSATHLYVRLREDSSAQHDICVIGGPVDGASVHLQTIYTNTATYGGGKRFDVTIQTPDGAGHFLGNIIITALRAKR